MHTIANSRKDKVKTLKEHILKDLIPSGFNGRINEIQEEHRQAIQERDNSMQATQYENVDFQSKIRAKDQQIATLKSCYVSYLENEDINNGMTIITKSHDEAEYPYISIYRQHDYRRYKTRVLLARNQGGNLFAERDTSNAIV